MNVVRVRPGKSSCDRKTIWRAIFPATASDRVASSSHLTKSDSAAADVCFAGPVTIVHLHLAARCIFTKARCIFRTASDHSSHADRCSMYFHKPSQASHSFCPDCMCFHVVLWCLFRFPVEMNFGSPRQIKLSPQNHFLWHSCHCVGS